MNKYPPLFLTGIASLLTIAQAAEYASNPTMEAAYDMSVYQAAENPDLVSFFPHQLTYEFVGPMSFRRSGGDATIQNISLKARLMQLKPGAKTNLGVDLGTSATWFSARGNDVFKSEQLYALGINAMGGYALSGESTVIFGLTGGISSAFNTFSRHSFQMGLMGGYSHQFSNDFSLQLGVYYSPEFPSFPILPIIGFYYSINDQWSLQLSNFRLRAIHKVGGRFSWGPFVGAYGNSWNIKRDSRDMRFSVSSAIAGVQTESALGQWGKLKPYLALEAGFTFAGHTEYRTHNGRHKLESINTNPGLYIQTGIEFKF